ncbi:MAG: PAS domain S-box protein [Candidatus Eisenbacteria bacterium]
MTTTMETTDKRQMEVLADLLAGLSSFDAKSETAMSLWFSRFLERATEALHIAGSAIIVSDGAQFRVVTKHGLTDRDAESLTEQLRSALSRPGRQLERPATECRREQVDPKRFTFRLEERVHSVFHSNLADSRDLWATFVTDQEPGDRLANILYTVATHIASLITNTILREQIAASGADLDKMARELKEMQVCSLNIMEDLQKKNRDLAMLNKMSQEITKYMSLPELAGTAVAAISSAFDGACVSLYVMDSTGSAFIPYHTTGTILTDVDDLGLPAESEAAKDFARGEELTFDSTDQAVFFPLAKAVGAKSGLLVPLRSKNTTLGFLAVCEARWHRVFTDEEKDNLRVLAGTLSVAMENSNLLARTAAQIEEMNLLTEYIETVVDSVDLAVMVVGADLKIGMINKGFERIHNQNRDQFIGRHILEAFPHLAEQGFEEIYQQVFDGVPFTRFGWRRKVIGGKEVVQNMRIFPHRSSNGNIIGAIVIIEDVTEKADLEVQLAKSEAKFQGLVEDLGDGYLIVTHGKIVYANKAACQMTAIPVSELLGMEVGRILSDENLVSECMSQGRSKVRRESRLIHSTGTWIPIEVSLNTCEYGGDHSISVVIRDVTERKKFEKQLEKKNRETTVRNEQITRLNSELEATVNKLRESQENLIKSERLAAITETSVAANHEINNPLFSILGQAQLLLRRYGDQDEDTSQRLKVIEESALRIACVTKKLANLAEPVVKEYAGLATHMIDIDKSTAK